MAPIKVLRKEFVPVVISTDYEPWRLKDLETAVSFYAGKAKEHRALNGLQGPPTMFLPSTLSDKEVKELFKRRKVKRRVAKFLREKFSSDDPVVNALEEHATALGLQVKRLEGQARINYIKQRYLAFARALETYVARSGRTRVPYDQRLLTGFYLYENKPSGGVGRELEDLAFNTWGTAKRVMASRLSVHRPEITIASPAEGLILAKAMGWRLHPIPSISPNEMPGIIGFDRYSSEVERVRVLNRWAKQQGKKLGKTYITQNKTGHVN
jgi:hypothetical protein